MRNKLLFGSLGGIVIATAVAVPLGVTLSQTDNSLEIKEKYLADLRKNAEEITNRIVQLSTDNAEYFAEVERLNQQIPELEKELEDARARYEAETTTLKNSQSQLGDSIDQVNQIADLLVILEEQADSLRDAISETEDNIAAQQQRLDFMRRTGSSSDDINLVQANIEQLNSELEDLETELNEKENEISEQNAKRLDLSTQISYSSSQWSAAQRAVESAENRLKDAQDRMQSFQDQIDANNEQLQLLESQNQNIENDINNLKSQLQAKDTAISHLNSEINKQISYLDVLPTTPGFDVVDISTTTITDSVILQQLRFSPILSGDTITPLTSIISNKVTTISSPELLSHATSLNTIVLPNLVSVGGPEAFKSSPINFAFLPKLEFVPYSDLTPYKYANMFNSIINSTTTKVALPAQFNNTDIKNAMFGRGRWNNISFVWID